jgi:hypothetical protein
VFKDAVAEIGVIQRRQSFQLYGGSKTLDGSFQSHGPTTDPGVELDITQRLDRRSAVVVFGSSFVIRPRVCVLSLFE